MIQLNIWWWIIGIGLAFIIGAILFAAFYFVYMKLYERYLRKRMPKDAQTLLNAGPDPKLNPEEVKENERRKLEKFREFEKLRRRPDSSGKPTVERTVRGNEGRTGSAVEIPERSLLPNEPHTSNKGTDRTSKSRIQLIEERDI